MSRIHQDPQQSSLKVQLPPGIRNNLLRPELKQLFDQADPEGTGVVTLSSMRKARARTRERSHRHATARCHHHAHRESGHRPPLSRTRFAPFCVCLISNQLREVALTPVKTALSAPRHSTLSVSKDLSAPYATVHPLSREICSLDAATIRNTMYSRMLVGSFATVLAVTGAAAHLHVVFDASVECASQALGSLEGDEFCGSPNCRRARTHPRAALVNCDDRSSLVRGRVLYTLCSSLRTPLLALCFLPCNFTMCADTLPLVCSHLMVQACGQERHAALCLVSG
eukprot:6175439-Pleurochrysis_carterae.AAC.2